MSGITDWFDLLHQEQVWIDEDGREHRIAGMDPAYCRPAWHRSSGER
ncbi:hypothetical protein [Nonomuraea basaltis]|nr:hypothetical protein [Nonomuraea basaltis]